ncbi:MAG: alpha-glucosidase [Treponema sp.]|jgi:oligo-1,6-glucosidase|nr:alpha-glucosidase [Treponema sp.]
MNGAWWKRGVIYQIYPRSFQDSNNDGIGDIGGIISRLPEIAALGVSALWLSPVYRSPQVDNGYDISDYCDIDPIFGTLADMDRLIAEAKKLGLRIIMDLVINHTSDEHVWFQKSRRREAPYTDYYIWRPGKAKEKPGKKALPNNWTSFFMEDAWTFDDARGEYYLHLFHHKQPDLNYKNPAVLEEIKRILRFWLDRGVAGFRCDVINVLWKTSLDDGKKNIMLTGREHYLCQDGNHEILRVLRREVLDSYGAFTVGETALVELDDAKLLCGAARRELDEVFYFDHLEVDRLIARFVPGKFRASALLARLAAWQRGLEWNALYLENHDQSRIVSHYGAAKYPRTDRRYSKAWFNTPEPAPAQMPQRPKYRGACLAEAHWALSAKLLATLLFTLKGTPFIYQGQEIGMTNFDFKSLDEVKDIETRNLDRLMKKFRVPAPLRWAWLRVSSRDNARTPFQWEGGAGAGFSAATPWLGINANHSWLNYGAQRDDPDSVLAYYRMMLRLRENSETLVGGDFVPLYANKRLMAYQRRGTAARGAECYTVALNFSAGRIKLPAGVRAALEGAELAAGNTGRSDLLNCAALESWECVVAKKAVV